MLSGKEVLTNAPIGILCCTQDARIVHANRKAARLLGFRSVAALPLNLQGISPLLAHPEDYFTLRQTLNRRGIIHNAIIAITKVSGSRAWLQVNAYVAVTAEGDQQVVFHLLDVTRQVETEQQLHNLSVTDPLTGLCNRRHFEKVVAQGIQKSTQCADKFGILYVDIDGFKKINDTYGHCLGDKVLCAFAQRVSRAVRNADVVARVGGDEFCILVSQIGSVEGVYTMAQGLLNIMKKPLSVNCVELTVQASIGAAIYPFHGRTLEELIDSADKNMYAAKRFCLPDESLSLPRDGERMSGPLNSEPC